MKRVIVDASVVLAGLFKDGTVRDALLNPADTLFVAPAYVRDEVARHVPEVASRAKLPVPTVEAVLEDLLGTIDLVPPGVYSGWVNPARRLARGASATGDVEYVALALALDSPIWTLDKDFRRVPGIKVLSTRDLMTR